MSSFKTPAQDDFGRPVKRKRDDLDNNSPSSSRMPPSPSELGEELLAIPRTLIVSSIHEAHAQSLCISLLALRRCLAFGDSIDPSMQCRAWTALAEVGINVIAGGFSRDAEHLWAKGIEEEVEHATSRGLMIAQKHPTLRNYKPRLTFINAQLSLWQHNVKFARMTLRRLLNSFLPCDPPHLVYTAHLKFINALLTPVSTATADPSSDYIPTLSPKDLNAALTAVQSMQDLAKKNSHETVVVLTQALRLRILIGHDEWARVDSALGEVESTLDNLLPTLSDLKNSSPISVTTAKGTPLSTQPLRAQDQNTPPSVSKGENAPTNHSPPPSEAPRMNIVSSTGSGSVSQLSSSASTTSLTWESPAGVTMKDEERFLTSLRVHTLLMAVIFFTYAGEGEKASAHLKTLHELLDSGFLSHSSKVESHHSEHLWGLAKVPIPDSPPLAIQLTHPRIVLVLSYLISAVSKRDPVGRKPKKKVFALEGLAVWEREWKDWQKNGIALPPYATKAEYEGLRNTMLAIKADLLAEIVSVCITRNEEAEAQEYLSKLIRWTTDPGHSWLWERYQARILLFWAWILHSQVFKGYIWSDNVFTASRAPASENAIPSYSLSELHDAVDAYQVTQLLADERGATDLWCIARIGEVLARVGGLFIRLEYEGNNEPSTPQSRQSRKRRERARGDECDEVALMDIDRDPTNAKDERQNEDDDGDEENTDVESEEDEPDYDEEDERNGAVDTEIIAEWEEIKALANDALSVAQGLGGTLIALSHLISSILLSPPISRHFRRSKDQATHLLKAKSQLRTGLQLATMSGDNYLRALILTFIGSHFVYTAPEEAIKMFTTVEQLAAGLGARPKIAAKTNSRQSTPARGTQLATMKPVEKNQDALGNVPLRAYAAGKVLGIYRRSGDEVKAEKQGTFLRTLISKSNVWKD